MEVDGDGLGRRRVGPQKKEQEAVASRSHSPAQPSPGRANTHACAQAGWLSGPCPDLPVVSLPPQPVAVPAALDLEAAVARAVPLLQRAELLGVETRIKVEGAGAQSRAKMKPLYSIPFDGGGWLARCETSSIATPHPLPFVDHRGGIERLQQRSVLRPGNERTPTCAPAPATTDWHPQGSCSRDHGHRSALWAPCHPPSSPVSPSMKCHESRMPVECHDHRPAPTHPRESCRLFFFVSATTSCCSVTPTLQALSQPICNSTLAFPSPVPSSPVQPSPSPALLACPVLSCPAPALCLPSSLPSPIDRPPRKKPPSCLAVPCEQKSCPLSSIHPSSSAAVSFSPFSSLLSCSGLVNFFLPSLLSVFGRPTPPSAAVRIVQLHPIPSGSSTRTLAPLVPRISEPEPAFLSAANNHHDNIAIVATDG